MPGQSRLINAYLLFDYANSQDPNREEIAAVKMPKEVVYGHRMTHTLLKFEPNASEALLLAARCQHIRRWEIPRESYPMDRVGYLRWREDLKKFHAKTAGEILEKVGYESELIDRVAFLLQKKLLKKDPETQILEDVICLVFLEYYLDAFIAEHDDEKLKTILAKTWGKMSERGHKAAQQISYSQHAQTLLNSALEL